jgi:hypothetical protein
MKNIVKTGFGTLALSAWLCVSFSSQVLGAGVTAAAPTSSKDDTSFKQQYDDAADAGGKSNKANGVTVGLWGAIGALCGFNCYNYMVTLDAAKKELLAASQSMNAALGATAVCTVSAGPSLAGIAALKSLDALIASTESEKAVAGAQKATIAAGGQSVQDAKEEGIEAAFAPVHSAVAGIPLAINTYMTTTCAVSVIPVLNLLTAQECARCATAQAGLAALGTAYAAFQTAQATYIAALESVRTMGLACTGGGVAVGVADFAITQALGGELTEGMMGAAGALPPAYFLMKMILTKQTPVGTASSLGVGSCLTAAGALLEVGMKTMNMMKTDESSEENRENSKKLESRNGIRGENPALLKVLELLLPPAYASGNSARSSFLSACGYKEKTSSQLLSCGMQADPDLAKILGDQANQNRIFSSLDKAFGRHGVSSQDFITEKPMSIDKIITLMTLPKPAAAPKVKQLYLNAQQKIRAQAGSGAFRSAAAQGPGSAPAARAVPVAPQAPVLDGGSSEQPVLKKVEESAGESLFEAATRRFRSWKSRIFSR